MTYILGRPWWKRWLPVICWRHRALVLPHTACIYCLLEQLNEEEKRDCKEKGLPEYRRVFWDLR